MSLLDAFFGRGGLFRGAKCKTLLKMAIPRMKLLRNRRELQLKQMRKEISNLLASGQEATARIRVEHVIREENMMAAQEILELFCELIVVRLPIIESQRECPLDLKEAISSICFAAPRCADLPELQQVQMMFSGKYGKDFVNAAAELLPDSGVNRQIIELLSVRAPPIDIKLKLLKEIADEHGVDWDPFDSETTYEDLLNGPGHLINNPPQQDTKSHELESESESDLDFLDLPEVPRSVIAPPTTEHNDAPKSNSSDQLFPFVAPPSPPKPAVPPHNLVAHLSSESSQLPTEEEAEKLSSASGSAPADSSIRNDEPLPNSSDQFIPFMIPPLMTVAAPSAFEPSSQALEKSKSLFPASESVPADLNQRSAMSTPVSSDKFLPFSVMPPMNMANLSAFEPSSQSVEKSGNLSPVSESIPAALKTSDMSVPNSSDQFLPFIATPQMKMADLSAFEPSSQVVEKSENLSPASESINADLSKRSEIDKELRDAVTAAHAAAETAERAAAAARLAASLAQVKMAELIGNPGHVSELTEKEKGGDHDDDDDYDDDDRPVATFQTVEDDSLRKSAGSPDGGQAHHSLYMEDDPYLSYPNLFSRQNSSSVEPSSADHSRGNDPFFSYKFS